MNNHNPINTSQIAIINVTQSESVTPYCCRCELYANWVSMSLLLPVCM